MTSVKISALPEAATIAGGELLPIVQNGETRRATASQIATLTGALLPDNNLSDVPNDELAAENLSVSFVVADLAALKALGSRPEAVIVETGQAKGVWQWEAGSSTTADDALVVQPTSGTAGRYKRVYSGALNARWFGCAIDGTTNDTAALEAFLLACSTLEVDGLIPGGVLMVDDVAVTLAGDLHIECHATIKNISGAAADDEMVAIDGDSKAHSVYWKGGIFDANDSGFTTFLIFDCDKVVFSQTESFGMLGNASSPSSAGSLSIFDCNDVTVSPGFIHDCPVGTAGAGAVPRALSLSDNTTVTVKGGLLKTLNAGIITSGNQRVVLSNIDMETLTDNGVYLVEVVGDRYADGDVFIADCNIYGSEEGIVPSFGGKTYVKGGTIEGATNAALSMGDCGPVVLDSVTIIGTEGVGAIVKIRSGSTACEGLEIRNCRITAEVAGGLMELTTGSLGYFKFEGNDVTWVHNSDYTPSTNIINWTTGDYYEFNRNTWTFTDASADIANGNWGLQLPLAVTALSAVTNNRIVNRTGNASAIFRFVGNRQQLVTFDSFQSFASSQTETALNSADLTSAEPRDVFGTAIPTSGYWQAGSRIINLTPSFGIMGWVCTVAGTPGTWVPFGGSWRTVAASAVGVARNSVNGAGDATETTLVTVSIPANSMGPNGAFRFDASWSCTESANAKTVRARWAATGSGLTGGRLREDVMTNLETIHSIALMTNVNATNSQKTAFAFNAGRQGWDGSTGALGTNTIDTTLATDLVFTTAWAGATASETITLERYLVEVLYGA